MRVGLIEQLSLNGALGIALHWKHIWQPVLRRLPSLAPPHDHQQKHERALEGHGAVD